MPALDRAVSLRGPRFFLDGEDLRFVLHLDASTRVGPRPATKEDAEEHPEAWAKFVAGEMGAAGSDATEEGLGALLTFETPEDGEPIKEVGPHASRRAAARARGERA